MSDTPSPSPDSLTGHVIIAGYGIVGRCVAETLAARKIPFCIVELNPTTVTRLSHGPVPIIKGDIRDKAIMLQAGIERASTLALAMPDEVQALEALRLARSIRPDVTIIVRCTFSSAGLQAAQMGAAVVVAEQVVAREFARSLEKSLPISNPAS
jgi:CPA2 family monovalent cation:H+ antiporter-2